MILIDVDVRTTIINYIPSFSRAWIIEEKKHFMPSGNQKYNYILLNMINHDLCMLFHICMRKYGVDACQVY